MNSDAKRQSKLNQAMVQLRRCLQGVEEGGKRCGRIEAEATAASKPVISEQGSIFQSHSYLLHAASRIRKSSHKPTSCVKFFHSLRTVRARCIAGLSTLLNPPKKQKRTLRTSPTLHDPPRRRNCHSCSHIHPHNPSCHRTVLPFRSPPQSHRIPPGSCHTCPDLVPPAAAAAATAALRPFHSHLKRYHSWQLTPSARRPPLPIRPTANYSARSFFALR